MPKLHELLASSGTAKAQADKCRADLLNTFEKKRHLFGQKLVTFISNVEGVPPVTEEQSDLQTTVPRELSWLADIWSKALDLDFQIDIGNIIARADVTLDNDSVLLKDVPATALLQLEKRANEIHAFLSAVPTLDPAKGFKPDGDRGVGVYRARDDEKRRTKKEQRALVMYPATVEHPAQVQLITEDVIIGSIRTQEWSGMITPAEKAAQLGRCEEVRRAIKTARARANDIKVEPTKVGATLFKYILG